jgi:type VI secretion system protein ImpJ
MKVPQRVIWSEGMFMSPQHLQQLDRYHEGYVGARLGGLFPYDWGVVAIELDERALVAGQVRVQRFEGVLPDGIPLAFDGAHPEVPAIRPVEGHFKPTQQFLEVFLAVPAEREGSPAISSSASPTAGLRFFTSARVVVDAAGGPSGGAADVTVGFAQRHVALLFGNESRDDFEAVKIAEIYRDASGALAVRQEYIPPIRRIGASPWLMNRMRQLIQVMAGAQRSLAEKQRHRDGALIEVREGDVTSFLKFYSINAFIPIVNHLIERADTSPEDAYLLLSQFAGQLASFAVGADPTKLPKFYYTDLATTFGELITEIIRLLNVIEKPRFVKVNLESREDGLHFGRLDDEKLQRGATYFLTLRTNQPEQQTAMQVPQLSKIASWGNIADIVASALPGVPIKVEYRPPSEIPARAGVLYFALQQTGQYWQNVEGERTIAIYLPPPYDPTQIQLELLAIPRSAGAAQ